MLLGNPDLDLSHQELETVSVCGGFCEEETETATDRIHLVWQLGA